LGGFVLEEGDDHDAGVVLGFFVGDGEERRGGGWRGGQGLGVGRACQEERREQHGAKVHEKGLDVGWRYGSGGRIAGAILFWKVLFRGGRVLVGKLDVAGGGIKEVNAVGVFEGFEKNLDAAPFFSELELFLALPFFHDVVGEFGRVVEVGTGENRGGRGGSRSTFRSPAVVH